MTKSAMDGNFAYADEVVPGIRWDAKYASSDNFTGQQVDGYLANRVAGTRALFAALARAHEQAAELGFGLFLFDAYRPQRAVDAFIRWVQQPEDGSTKQQYYPNICKAEIVSLGYVDARSGHSRGSTVDLTLYRLDTGELTPMGGGFDLMDPISHHGADGIAPTEARNREHLGSLMDACGFQRYENEWWHYSLKYEPHPDTYFDFPITNAHVAARSAAHPATDTADATRHQGTNTADTTGHRTMDTAANAVGNSAPNPVGTARASTPA